MAKKKNDDLDPRPDEKTQRLINRREALKRIAGVGVTVFASSAFFSCGDDDGGGGEAMCTNSCEYAFDEECDDGGEGSLYSLCDFGTDCGDCGTRYGGYASGGYSSGGYSSGGYSSSYSSGYSSSYSSSYSSQYCSGYGSLYYYSYRCHYS